MNVGKMMNEAYVILKTMTVGQLREAKLMVHTKMNAKEAALFIHQCNYTVRKKQEGKW